MFSKIFVALGVSGALAAAAPVASAVTVSSSGDTVTITGGDEVNNVGIGDAFAHPGAISIQDTAGVTAGSGCAQDMGNSTPTFECGDQATTKVVVSLGGGGDQLSDRGNVIWSRALAILVDAGGGNDVIDLHAEGSTDQVLGGDGDDTIGTSSPTGQGVGGHNIVDGEAGDDRISGGSGDETLHGGVGDDHVDGGSGDDHVFGDEGNDTVAGGGDNDTVDGGAGQDSLIGDESDLSVTGNDTIEAVDGERDTVSCGLGADVVNADAIDVVGTDECEQVNRQSSGSGGGGGHFTAVPHPAAFPHHCHRVHGHRVCTPAHPLANHTYRGRTNKGRAVKVKVARNGRGVSFNFARVDVKCPSADNSYFVTDVTQGGHPRTRPNGTFSNTSRDSDIADGITVETFYVVGEFDNHRAAGVIVVNAVSGGEKCTSGRVTWTGRT